MQTHRLAQDLDHILACTTDLWTEFRGARIFFTGGTGFFGSWILQSLMWANDKLNLNLKVVVLTRNPDVFKEKLGHPAIEFLKGDVRTFSFPEAGPKIASFSHIIHAATPNSAELNTNDPLLMFDTIVEGTRRVLDFARKWNVHPEHSRDVNAISSNAHSRDVNAISSNAHSRDVNAISSNAHSRDVNATKCKVLFISSGAVYGKQPPSLRHIDETYLGSPDPLDSETAYGQGKRAAEFLCQTYHSRYGVKTSIARCFAFVGPYLPLNAHFAIGNFIRDAMNGGPIKIHGDGTPYRSYLYTSDLVIWLLTILIRGESCRAYNVGSEEDYTIAEIAQHVAKAISKNIEIHVSKSPPAGIQSAESNRYVPSTQRALSELQLKPTIDLNTAIIKTLEWYRGW